MWRFLSKHSDEQDVPQVLESLNLKGIAKYMKSDQCKNVFIMAGAGISTSAGIPDFRSPETGLYANLARLNLPYPEAVFEINFFRKNPVPFFTLAQELAPGRFRPTPTHSFIRLLAEKKLLHTCFTQNIDTLERRAGVPEEKIVEAHGSFATQNCIDCEAAFPDDKYKAIVDAQEIPRCQISSCNGLVKPAIVFFGESLPPAFHKSIRYLRDADLLIVMGTSLTVHPFASLTGFVPEDCPRLLLNLDHVGGWGSRINDVACLKKCDDAVRELCKELGWEEDLDRLWDATTDSLDEAYRPAATKETAEETELTEEEKLKAEVDKLTQEIDASLKIAEKHQKIVQEDLKKGQGSSKEVEVKPESVASDVISEKQEPSVKLEEAPAEKTDAPSDTEPPVKL